MKSENKSYIFKSVYLVFTSIFYFIKNGCENLDFGFFLQKKGREDLQKPNFYLIKILF